MIWNLNSSCSICTPIILRTHNNKIFEPYEIKSTSIQDTLDLRKYNIKFCHDINNALQENTKASKTIIYTKLCNALS